jgi:hypothetical protein
MLKEGVSILSACPSRRSEVMIFSISQTQFGDLYRAKLLSFQFTAPLLHGGIQEVFS